ncbi:MAG: non-canonical purine NTP diphosphatase [Prevotella sp.]|nr:non-canonical purine NTP diphosphatase [Prevotella sp.]
MKIVFATNNRNKLAEIRSILGDRFEIVSLKDIGCDADIPETGSTLEENAMQKARYIYDNYGLSVFADDTGLEVDALGGAPGVYSARYAGGEGHDSEANMTRLLSELGENNNRKAQFRTVIALLLKDDSATDNNQPEPAGKLFEGIAKGEIILERRGGEGFGYDPIFMPEGYDRTFAELGLDVKNKISHRAKAVERLAEYLKEL